MKNIDQLLNEKLQIAKRLADQSMCEIGKIQEPFSENNSQVLTLALIEENKFYIKLLSDLLLQLEKQC